MEWKKTRLLWNQKQQPVAHKFTVVENLLSDAEAKSNLVEENTLVMESKTSDVGNKFNRGGNKFADSSHFFAPVDE